MKIKIVNNIELNLSLKVRNILGGDGFKTKMNMFQKKATISSDLSSNIIFTGMSMKDRIKFFNTNNSNNTNLKKTNTFAFPNKITLSKQNSDKNEINSNSNSNNNTIKRENTFAKNNIKDDKKEEKITNKPKESKVKIEKKKEENNKKDDKKIIKDKNTVKADMKKTEEKNKIERNVNGNKKIKEIKKIEMKEKVSNKDNKIKEKEKIDKNKSEVKNEKKEITENKIGEQKIENKVKKPEPNKNPAKPKIVEINKQKEIKDVKEVKETKLKKEEIKKDHIEKKTESQKKEIKIVLKEEEKKEKNKINKEKLVEKVDKKDVKQINEVIITEKSKGEEIQKNKEKDVKDNNIRQIEKNKEQPLKTEEIREEKIKENLEGYREEKEEKQKIKEMSQEKMKDKIAKKEEKFSGDIIQEKNIKKVDENIKIKEEEKVKEEQKEQDIIKKSEENVDLNNKTENDNDKKLECNIEREKKKEEVKEEINTKNDENNDINIIKETKDINGNNIEEKTNKNDEEIITDKKSEKEEIIESNIENNNNENIEEKNEVGENLEENINENEEGNEEQMEQEEEINEENKNEENEMNDENVQEENLDNHVEEENEENNEENENEELYEEVEEENQDGEEEYQGEEQENLGGEEENQDGEEEYQGEEQENLEGEEENQGKEQENIEEEKNEEEQIKENDEEKENREENEKEDNKEKEEREENNGNENIKEEKIEEIKEDNDEAENIEEEKIEEEIKDESDENEENLIEDNMEEIPQENYEEELNIEEKQYGDEWEYSCGVNGSIDENDIIDENNGDEKEEESEEIIEKNEEIKKIEETNKERDNNIELQISTENHEQKDEEIIKEVKKEEQTNDKNVKEELKEKEEDKELQNNNNNLDSVKSNNDNNNESQTQKQDDKTAQQNIENKPKDITENNIEQKSSPRTKSKEIKKPAKKKDVPDLGFEILDNYDEDIQPCSTMSTSIDSGLPENILESINYESYLSGLSLSEKKEIPHETFCSGFFLASFPKKNGQVIETLSKFPASCGHKECSELPPMKPEIIFRYPLKDTKNLELNNLSATICFPTGIKMCYSENEEPKKIEDYVAQITNQKGERYYMRTFHFYKKMSNMDFGKEYEVNPLKYTLMKFTDENSLLKEEDFTEEITNNIQKKLDFCTELGFVDLVYIPCCLCLISKYPYIAELGKCLETIYRILGTKPGLLNFEINDLIMYLINSIPIPEKNTKVQFYIPYCNNPKIELQCPKVDDISTMNSNFIGLFKYLSIDNIVLIFRILLSEKKILFIHNDYTELTNITNSFISLLYPFQWVHTYIPIMSAQMLKYLETFLPFLSGIHMSLMNLVEKLFKEGENDDSEEIFLIYIKTNEILLSSNFRKNKTKFSKYIQNNLPPLPFEKELKKELKIIEASKKQLKSDFLENKIRDAFINIFVKMFHDYEKYIISLDNDVVFNKVLFIKNAPNKEEKTEQFFNEFIDSQLFQQFTQNSPNIENSYFKKKLKEFKEKENKSIKRSENLKNVLNSQNKKEITYLVLPYIGLKNNEKNNIESIMECYKEKEEENKEIKNKIIENDINIDSDKYINSKCIIYLNPEKKDLNKNNEKNKKREINLGAMTEKQLDQIKDNIKDTVINIFKSQIDKKQIQSLKKSIFSNLETPAGKTFFVSLISNNNRVISLQENSFLFLEAIIRGVLNSVLKSEETDQLIEEIVKLIISSKFFEIEDGINSNNKKNKTIFKQMKKFLHNYSKITQKNLWKMWYDLELKRKKNENSDEDEIKEVIILDICRNMIFLQISKSIVKNITENINKIAFEEGSELYEKIKKEYINLITKANYISEANNY